MGSGWGESAWDEEVGVADREGISLRWMGVDREDLLK